ncbi:hypothetical protein, partial [Escherichia coli]|uniref:hypothetical protein n=1 Tax=Escherichia coli TaxID=562 RepID=UPI001100961B
MFDREMINENKEAFFLYVNGRGELSAQCVIKVAEKGDYLQGYSLTRRAFRTFLKDRVIQMFSSDQELNKVASETDFISILPPPPPTTSP